MVVNSFVFLESMYAQIECLEDDKAKLEMYQAICEYAFNHKEIEYHYTYVKAMMVQIKNIIDSNFKKRLVNGENGKKGGRPKMTQSIEEVEDKVDLKGAEITQDKPKKTETKPKENRKKANDNPSESLMLNDKCKMLNVECRMLNGKTYSSEFVDVFNDFKLMRKKQKKPLSTERAEKSILNRLDDLSDDEQTKIAILEQSIVNCWIDVYPLKNNHTRETIKSGEVDTLPVYDTSNNHKLDQERLNELLSRRNYDNRNQQS